MAEKRTIELEVQDNSKSLKAQYRDAVKELQNIAAAYGETSDQAIKAAKAAADLKDQIEFSKDLVGAFNPDAKFDALTKSFGGVLDGFQAVEGGLALIGVEGEAVQETMLKVQSAMALSQGLQGLMSAKDSFKQLGAVAKTALSGIKTGIASTGIGVLVIALGAIVAYWEDIKKLVSGVNAENQRGVELAQKRVAQSERELQVFEKQENQLRLQGKTEEQIIKIKEAKLKKIIVEAQTEKAKHEQNKKLEVAAAKRNRDFAEKIIQLYIVGLTYWAYMVTGIIDGVTNAFVFLAKSSFNFGKQLRGIMFEALITPVELALKGVNSLLELAGIATINVKGIMGGIRDTYTGLENDIGKFINSLDGSSLTKGLFNLTQEYASKPLANMLFDPDAVAKEYDETIKVVDDKLLDAKDKIAQGQLTLKQGSQQTANDIKNINEKSAQDDIDIQRRLIDEKQRLREESRQKELDQLDIDYQRKLEDAEKELTNDKDKEAKLKALKIQFEESKRADLNAVNSKWDKIDYDKAKAANEARIKLEDEQFNALQKLKNSQKEQELLELAQSYDAKFEAAQNNAELEKALTEQFNKEQAAIIKKYRDEDEKAANEKAQKEKERVEKLNDLRLNAAKDTLQTISSLTELFAGKSKEQQKKAFQVQKAVSISSALVDTYAAASKALKESPAPFNYIAMAATITAGLLNVKKIASQKFDGGSTSTSGGNNTPSVSGGSMTAQFNTIGSSGINQLATLQQQPVQAYVVSGEVTSAQSLDRNRVQNATL